MSQAAEFDREAEPPAVGTRSSGVKEALLRAVHQCLERHGYAALSTRQVAEEAGVPLSQIHYHFKSKRGLVLALLEDQNRRLLERQSHAFTEESSLSARWDRACDYLDQDLSSGYVRILQEMMSAGWSDPVVASAVRAMLEGWYALLTQTAREALERFGGLGPFTPEEAASLIGNAFLGSEAIILLGLETGRMPARQALRKFGEVLRTLETTAQRRAP